MSEVRPLFNQQHSNEPTMRKSPFFATVVAFIVGLIVGICVFIAGAFIVDAVSPETNHLSESKLYGGYLPFDMYKIYDAETGVYYAVSENGGVAVMVDKDGNPLMVDGGRAL